MLSPEPVCSRCSYTCLSILGPLHSPSLSRLPAPLYSAWPEAAGATHTTCHTFTPRWCLICLAGPSPAWLLPLLFYAFHPKALPPGEDPTPHPVCPVDTRSQLSLGPWGEHQALWSVGILIPGPLTTLSAPCPPIQLTAGQPSCLPVSVCSPSCPCPAQDPLVVLPAHRSSPELA